MSGREKNLAIVLTAIIGIAVVGNWVYPNMIRPLFDYGDELESARKELDGLLEDRDALEMRLDRHYRDYVIRNSGIDAEDVYQYLQDDVYDLMVAAGLSNPGVKTRVPSEDRKTKVATLSMSVNANGPFSKCIQFLESFYKLPYVVRVDSVKFTPTNPKQQNRNDEVKFDADIEALVPPRTELFALPRGAQPKSYARGELSDFRNLRRWTPFTRKVAEPPKPPVDNRNDDKPTPPPPPPPPPSGPPDWRDANTYVARMKAMSSDGSRRVDEVLIERTIDFANVYVKVGEELDGGELVLVNAWGAVVHKQDEKKDYGYFVYPFGEMLTSRVPLEDATAWPEIQLAMQRYLREHSEDDDAEADPEESAAIDAQHEARDKSTDALLRGIAEALGPDDLLGAAEELVGPLDPLDEGNGVGPDADTDGALAADADSNGAGAGQANTSGVPPSDTNAEKAQSSNPVRLRPGQRPPVKERVGTSGRQPVRRATTTSSGRKLPAPGKAVSRPVGKKKSQSDAKADDSLRDERAADDEEEKENDHVAPPE